MEVKKQIFKNFFKIISCFIFILIFFVSALYLMNCIQERISIQNYEKSLEKFQEYDVREINKKVDCNDRFILLVGRESCPYCRDFIPNFVQIL
ncbi:MAG: hypothetical protein Q4D42_00340, partial [Eubacteriales bacterium]|nr:hypothetical protein [Eubacteriales bacterium]